VVIPLKVVEFNDLSLEKTCRSASVSARELSAENKDATFSHTAMDAAPFGKDRKKAFNVIRRLLDRPGRRLRFEYQEDADVFHVSVMAVSSEALPGIPHILTGAALNAKA
jgi:hypothetical protein